MVKDVTAMASAMTLMSDSSASFRSRFSRIVAADADDDDCCDGVEDDMAHAH